MVKKLAEAKPRRKKEKLAADIGDYIDNLALDEARTAQAPDSTAEEGINRKGESGKTQVVGDLAAVLSEYAKVGHTCHKLEAALILESLSKIPSYKLSDTEFELIKERLIEKF